MGQSLFPPWQQLPLLSVSSQDSPVLLLRLPLIAGFEEGQGEAGFPLRWVGRDGGYLHRGVVGWVWGVRVRGAMPLPRGSTSATGEHFPVWILWTEPLVLPFATFATSLPAIPSLLLAQLACPAGSCSLGGSRCFSPWCSKWGCGVGAGRVQQGPGGSGSVLVRGRSASGLL